jgi:inorganic pyrophosphatase
VQTPAQPTPAEPRYAELPPHAAKRLRESLDAASQHPAHVWRDTAPLDADGTLTGYVEIPRGERTKWEFDIATNRLEVDRVMSESVGGYPVNYGYVPQTISFDGDPFDVLVLGPPLEGGQLVRGHIVGILYMDDEKGPDMKVVVTPVASDHALTEADKARIGAFFDAYKKPERAEGKWSKVLGWGSAAEGRQLVDTTHRFFEQGRAQP